MGVAGLAAREGGRAERGHWGGGGISGEGGPALTLLRLVEQI